MTEHSNMKTILYNTTDKKLGKRFTPQYLVDGRPGKLPSNLIELAIVESEQLAATSDDEKFDFFINASQIIV